MVENSVAICVESSKSLLYIESFLLQSGFQVISELFQLAQLALLVFLAFLKHLTILNDPCALRLLLEQLFRSFQHIGVLDQLRRHVSSCFAKPIPQLGICSVCVDQLLNSLQLLMLYSDHKRRVALPESALINWSHTCLHWHLFQDLLQLDIGAASSAVPNRDKYFCVLALLIKCLRGLAARVLGVAQRFLV